MSDKFRQRGRSATVPFRTAHSENTHRWGKFRYTAGRQFYKCEFNCCTTYLQTTTLFVGQIQSYRIGGDQLYSDPSPKRECSLVHLAVK